MQTCIETKYLKTPAHAIFLTRQRPLKEEKTSRLYGNVKKYF